MTNKYYAVDLENYEWEEFDSVFSALECAEYHIQYYRENCDPEWPMGVEGIVVLYGTRNEEIDDGYEGCKVLYRAAEVDRQELEPEEAEVCGCEYYCDYRMVGVE